MEGGRVQPFFCQSVTLTGNHVSFELLALSDDILYVFRQINHRLHANPIPTDKVKNVNLHVFTRARLLLEGALLSLLCRLYDEDTTSDVGSLLRITGFPTTINRDLALVRATLNLCHRYEERERCIH
ncbi:hypothetical protein EYF80_013356 [Liparis tanakae]|uniref:Uncharacterized protein n=1 Tax=Liparis tanakae TaxID=230148 RepID=A0A4Z2IFC9_9TELE|nr:hypothetical protein EYF80_013356 [Liparis tanakae]